MRIKMRASRTDAVAVLKSDHRQVERWFKEFEQTTTEVRRGELAALICTGLRVHAAIEEELFYPAFLDATGAEALHHEAIIEHHGALRLIEEIEQSQPSDGFFAARVSVLGELTRHHVKAEEKPEGLFAKVRRTDVDLEMLGRQLQVRRRQLSSAAGAVPLVKTQAA